MVGLSECPDETGRREARHRSTTPRRACCVACSPATSSPTARWPPKPASRARLAPSVGSCRRGRATCRGGAWSPRRGGSSPVTRPSTRAGSDATASTWSTGGCGRRSADSVVPMSIYDHDVQALGGGEADLHDYEDKVALVVNVASKCGLTPQYEALERLQETYGDRGFTVLGFPCNQFGGQ